MKRPRTMTVLGTLAGLAGLAYFVHLCSRTDLAGQLGELPPALIWVVPLIALPIAMGTQSWACAFPSLPGSTRPAFRTLFGIRLAGEAINNALVSAYVAGEPVKGLLAARFGATPATGLASALIGKTTFILGEVLFIIVGLGLAAWVYGGSSNLVRMFAAVAAAGLAVTLLAILVQQKSLVGRATRLLQALRLGPRAFWKRALPKAQAIDAAVRHYYAVQRREFGASVAWAAAGWLFGALELWLFLSLATTVENPLTAAIVLEAGVAVTKGLSFFVPGSIGVQEGGIVWLFQVTGVGADAGVTYAVVRRLRELFWIGMGFAALWWYLRAVKLADGPTLSASP